MTTKSLFIFSNKAMKTLLIFRYFAFCLLVAVPSMAQAQCPNLVWSDEFDGTNPDGTELDLSKWEPQIGDGCNYGICQWGNNELQYYKAENVVVSYNPEIKSGTLKILIKKEKNRRYNYTSARLRTKGLGDFTYGRFEARMKLLHGQGLWPAFWMLSSNEPRGGWPQSGEIDIMEFLGQDPKKVFGTVHYGDPYPNNKYQGKDFLLYGDETFADDFHVFAVEWEPGEIRWYVDDVLYSTKTAADIEADGAVWPFDPDASNPDPNLMHLLLNVAVGGNLPGSPDATTLFPNQVEIDWVRVYDNSAFKGSLAGNRLVPYQSSGQIYTLNNAPDGASIDWSVPAGASYVPVAGANAISVDWGGTGGDIVADTTDGCGLPASYRIDVTVESPFVSPTAAFSYTTTDLTVDLDGSASTDSDGSIISWDWDFGDDSSNGSGQLASHTYSSPGDYSVTLTVTDDDGATDSTTEDVSVSSGGDPTSLHVLSIVTGTINAGGGNKRGTATVTIHDDLEAPVSGATVFATFSGTFSDTVSGQTGPDGTVTLTTAGTARGGVTVNLCVDDVTHAALSYDSTQNDITCSGGH
jgi:beta-glucanase (GH16 family)